MKSNQCNVTSLYVYDTTIAINMHHTMPLIKITPSLSCESCQAKWQSCDLCFCWYDDTIHATLKSKKFNTCLEYSKVHTHCNVWCDFFNVSSWFDYIGYPNYWGRANSECGKLVKVIQNFACYEISATKRSRKHCSPWHYLLKILIISAIFIALTESINIIHLGTIHFFIWFFYHSTNTLEHK
jgi:hypothetical protein